MTPATIQERADKIRKATSTRGSSLWRGLRYELAVDVLREISVSTETGPIARQLATEALRICTE